VNVLTYHNDNSRTGQNTNETVLTPANVNANQFGLLYSVPVDGYVYAQPLVLTNVSIPSQGTHDIVYVATEDDSLYAIDAVNGFNLWQVNFLHPAAGVTTVSSADVGCSDLVPQIGITSTPVIDPATGTIYLLARTKENGAFVQRLHAIDAATHAEKFDGPVIITATVPGTGDESSGSTISFDPLREGQRAALLLQNGHVIISWASLCDTPPFHGWIMSYNASTLAQEAVWSVTPNGSDGGVWMGGSGSAGDASFNIYCATGNGTYDGTSDFGDSIVKLGPPAAGTFPLDYWFTPFNQATLSMSDIDLGSGGVLLLPELPAGSAHQHLLVQAGKQGTIYLIDRDNMGKYCSTCTNGDSQIVQETAALSLLMGSPAYWNGNLYFGSGSARSPDDLMAFSFNANNSGLISSAPTSLSPEQFAFPAPTPSISANGTTSGILWALDNTSYATSCCQTLHAYDATNLATELYNSNQAAANRDVPGGAVKFSVPTVANGRVYVGSKSSVSIYGLLQSKAVTPVLNPNPGVYSTPQSVSISDSSAGATIYYTTDGSTPTTSSTEYTAAIPVNPQTTINAIAAGGGFSASAVEGGTYTIQSVAPSPTFSPLPGTYASPQLVTLSDAGAGATIYYTIDGSTPTTGSVAYTGPFTVSATATINAIAAGAGFTASPVASGAYAIPLGGINFGSGFSGTAMTLNGNSTYNGTRLRLTDGGSFESASAFCQTAVNVQSFTTDFSFQLTQPNADGITFTVQGGGPTAFGSFGSSLGYAGISQSVAVKFDLYSNAGEGTNSTRLYTNGASPTVPATDMTSSGVNLHSGDVFNVHISYDGTTLRMTITDESKSTAAFSISWTATSPTPWAAIPPMWVLPAVPEG
jgi:hypothetical protein